MLSNQSLITFYADPDTDDLYHIEIRDFDRASQDYYALKRFSYTSEIAATQGDLIVQEDTVLIAPHNKMLNLINGVWYLNDFVSTTPVIKDIATQLEDRIEEVNEDIIVKAKGSITLTERTGFPAPFKIKMDIGSEYIESEFDYAHPANDFFNTPDQNNTLLLQYLFADIMTAFGETPPAVGDIIDGYDTTLTINGEDVVMTMRLKLIPTNTPFGTDTKLIGGFDFNVVNAGNIEIPLRVVFENLGPTTIFPLNIVFLVRDISAGRGGFQSITGGLNNLDANTEYWYTARYIYRDGHKTKTCFPVYTKTNNNVKTAILTIQASLDLDGTFADIEVYRKTDSGEFQLIERVRNPEVGPDGYYDFIDDGKVDQYPLQESQYIWTQSHQTHAVLRDRYVRGNVDYKDRDNTLVSTISLTEGDEDNSLPPNTNIQVYTKKRFVDGLTSFHKATGNINLPYEVDFSDQSLQIITQEDEDNKENGVYLKLKALPAQSSYNFIWHSLSNLAKPFYPERVYAEDEVQVNPTNPSFFVGYRYLYRDADGYFFADSYGDGNPINLRVPAVDPNTKEIITASQQYVQTLNAATTQVTAGGFGTQYILSSLIYKQTSNANVWESVEYQSFKTLAENTTVNGYVGLGSVRRGDSLGEDFQVLGLVDQSETYNKTKHGTFLTQTVTNVGRMYLQIAPGSEIDTARVEGLQILNQIVMPYIDFYTDPTITPTIATPYKFINTTPPIQSENALIYCGKTDNPLNIGYKKTELNDAIYWELKDSNIYESLITIEDLDNIQDEFPNQLVWSEPYLLGTMIAGSRNLNFTNVLNIQRDYGDIVRIEPLGNRLIVFTERGVAVVMVGEQLTQTPTGETIVEGINFLNSPVWVLKNNEPIQVGTIKQYQNNLFFSDGVDVYRLGSEVENLSNGAINLGQIRTQYTGYPFAGRQVAAPARMWATIDPKNKEYRISNGTKTYCYNFELNGWSGPHDYSETINTTFGDRSVGVVDNEIIEHNIGNLRGELEHGPDIEYDTIVESTSNDQGDAFTTKLFRKFYIESDGSATFSYSRDYEDFTDVELDEAREVHGLKHVGIVSDHQNSRYIFWRFLSKSADFLLKLVSFEYTNRNRR